MLIPFNHLCGSSILQDQVLPKILTHIFINRTSNYFEIIHSLHILYCAFIRPSYCIRYNCIYLVLKMNIKNYKCPYNILHYSPKYHRLLLTFIAVFQMDNRYVCVLVYSANSIVRLPELCIMQHINYIYNILYVLFWLCCSHNFH